MLVPLAIFIEGIPQTPDIMAIAGVGYLALFPTAVATILLTIVVRRAGPPFLSLVNYQVPIWAVIIGATVLGEALPAIFYWRSALSCGLFIATAAQTKPA